MIAAAGWLAAAALACRAELMRRRLEAVADAEHELRGALTAFGFALEAGSRVPDLTSELERARAALGDLAAARHGRLGERRPAEPVPVHGLVRAAVAAWLPAARASGRRVELDWRAGPIATRAHPGRLAQALGNLLANAVEHGTGPIRLEARRAGDRLRLEIVNGVGERGRGLRIASRAVEECGGTLSLVRGEGRTAAAIDLPLAS